VNKRTAILIAVVAVVIIALGLAQRVRVRGNEATADYETVPVRRDTIVATVNSSGNVTPAEQLILVFPSGGLLAQVRVQAGQQVTAGEELARLDTGQLELTIAQAEATLNINEARQEQARAGPDAVDIAAARAAVESAQASLDRLLAGPTAEDLESAKLSVEAARNQLWAAQAQRDSTKGTPFSPQASIDAAEAQVLVSEINVQQAILAQGRLTEQPSEADVALAQSGLAQAEAQLQKLQQMPKEEDLAIAEAQVEQARAALEQAKLRLADAVLVAPFSGTVASVGAKVGELVGVGAPMIVLADLDHYYVDASIDETDIGSVQVGQDVEISLDAFPDATLSGKVTHIDPLGRVAQGVVSYDVEIELRPSDVAVRPNMTAIVDIVVARKEGVLVVPNRAIKRDSSGRFYVEVISGGEVKRRSVTTGLSNELVTEIVSGLGEAEEAVVSAPRASILDEVGGGPFGFMGGSGR
jgi:HlyD family secretion protein